MEREKQIEKRLEEKCELVDVISDAMRNWDDYRDECYEEEIPLQDSFEDFIADGILAAGYRKQSEGRNVTENHPVDEFVCEKCGAIFREFSLIVIDEDDGEEYYYEFAFKFCPKCGMKVMGD